MASVSLDNLTRDGTHALFGIDIDGRSLRATDLDWSYGSRTPIAGTAKDLVLLLTDRLASGRLSPEA